MTENQPSADFPRDLLRQIATTKESRQLLADLIPEMLRLWAESGTGTGPTRKIARQSIAGLAGNSVKNAFLDKKGLGEAARLQELAADPEFVQAAAAETGAALDAVFESLAAALANMEALDAGQKEALAGAILADLFSGRGAPLITATCRIINDIHRHDPDFLARTLEPAFSKWVAGVDFGEIKETLDTSGDGISALVTMINTVLWQYPAKMVTLLSFLPPLVNVLLEAISRTIQTMNEKSSPDLVADIVLTLLRETRADSLAALINELAELTRRFQTGSALIGEPGAPQLPNDLFTLLSETLDRIDGRVLGKAVVALAEIKEAAAGAMTDALADHPDLMLEGLSSQTAARNARVRAANHRLTTLEGLDPETFNAALNRAFSGFDAQDAAETINNAAALANRFLEAGPDTVSEKAAAFGEALDSPEISDLLEQLGRQAGDALRPLARAVVPHLTRGFLAALDPEGEEPFDAAASAREMLFSFLNPQETPTDE